MILSEWFLQGRITSAKHDLMVGESDVKHQAEGDDVPH